MTTATTPGSATPSPGKPSSGTPSSGIPIASVSAAAGPGPSGTAPRPVVFRANCPHCRAGFELDPDALRLAVGGSARTTFYSFTCPECGEAVRKPAGERIVELLTDGGVRTMRLQGR